MQKKIPKKSNLQEIETKEIEALKEDSIDTKVVEDKKELPVSNLNLQKAPLKPSVSKIQPIVQVHTNKPIVNTNAYWILRDTKRNLTEQFEPKIAEYLIKNNTNYVRIS